MSERVEGIGEDMHRPPSAEKFESMRMYMENDLPGPELKAGWEGPPHQLLPGNHGQSPPVRLRPQLPWTHTSSELWKHFLQPLPLPMENRAYCSLRQWESGKVDKCRLKRPMFESQLCSLAVKPQVMTSYL